MTFVRLSIMMFLQFFIWGAWYVTAPRFLGQIGFTGNDFGWTYSVGPIAAIISPFFVGMIADRFFSTERVLGVLHLLGGAAMIGATVLMQTEKPSPAIINLIFFGHTLCYFPTLSLTNSLAMHTMQEPEKEFPLIRVSGTIGWIVAGVVLAALKFGGTIDQFYLAGGAAIALGLYSFSLPHTPPQPGKQVTLGELVGRDAWVLFKNPAFVTFILCSFLVCIPLAFYYQMAERTVSQAELAAPPFKMTFGQISEVLFMVMMPLFFARLGVKWMLGVGMLAWVIRYFLFAFGAPDGVAWMLIVGVVIHGICYDFFFVTGQIYTDKVAPSAIRGQAQGMLVLFTLGIGMLIGAQVAGQVEAFYTPAKTAELNERAKFIDLNTARMQKTIDDGLERLAETDPEFQAQFDAAWAKYAGQSAGGWQQNVAMFVQIRNQPDPEQQAFNKKAAAIQPIKMTKLLDLVKEEFGPKIRSAVGNVPDVMIGRLIRREQIRRLNGLSAQLKLEAMQAIDWKSIYMIPAIGAAVIMVFFLLVFYDRSSGNDSEKKDDLGPEKFDVDSP